MKKFKWHIELACRLYVFFMLTSYGLGKIIGQQFYRKGELPEDVAATTLGEAGSFDLAWTFMGYSNTYIWFIGTLQIIGSILLLFNRTKIFGIVILIPILSNIIVFDAIFFDDGNYGALASAIVYFSLLCITLFINKENVIKSVKTLLSSSVVVSHKLKYYALAIFIALLFFVLDQFLVNLFGH